MLCKHKKQRVSALALLLVAGSLFFSGTVIAGYSLQASLLAQDSAAFEVKEEVDIDFEEEKRNEDQQRNLEEWKRNELRHLKDRAREAKDMLRQIKRAKRQLPDEVASLEERVNNFKGAVEEAKRLVEQVIDEDGQMAAQDYIQEHVNDVTGDIWEEINALTSKLDVLRELKNQKKTCKEWARQVKQIYRDGKRNKVDPAKLEAFKAEADAQVQACEVAYANLKQFAEEGRWDEARDILEEYFWNNDFWQWLDEKRQEIQACGEISRFVKDTEREVKKARKTVEKLKRKVDVTELLALLDRADAVLEKAKAEFASGFCDAEAIQDYREELDQIGKEYEELLRDAWKRVPRLHKEALEEVMPEVTPVLEE